MKNFHFLLLFLFASILTDAQCLICTDNIEKQCLQGISNANATDATCKANFGINYNVFQYSTNDCSTISDCNTSLPVEFLDFYLDVKQNSIDLSWHTATEENNDYFIVERSINGREFKPLGKVDGYGTTTETQSYYFLDNFPANGQNYYRLKQVDFNQDYEYSGVISFEFQNKVPSLKIYPNPVTERLYFESNTNQNYVQILNTLGQVVFEKKYQVSNVSIDINNLQGGIYFLKNNEVVISFLKK